MANYETMIELLKKGFRPKLRPIVLSGPLGSGKFNAAMEMANVISKSENISVIHINNDKPTIESHVDINIVNVIKNLENVFIDDPLTKAIRVANRGIPATVVLDISDEDLASGIEEELLYFLLTKETSHNNLQLAKLEDDNEQNLCILLVSPKEIEPNTPLARRCISIDDFISLSDCRDLKQLTK